jgi:hypothetical protein
VLVLFLNPLAERSGSPFCDVSRSLSPGFDISLHPICTRKMASIRKQKSGRWRVQVRRKGRMISETFVRHEDAKAWSVDAERKIDRGEAPVPSRIGRLQTFGDLIDLHISDMCDVGKAPGRSKAATLVMLKRKLGRHTIVEVDRECIVEFGRKRAKEGAGPTTIGIDVGVIKLVIQHAAAVHGIPVRIEPIDLGRIALVHQVNPGSIPV